MLKFSVFNVRNLRLRNIKYIKYSANTLLNKNDRKISVEYFEVEFNTLKRILKNRCYTRPWRPEGMFKKGHLNQVIHLVVFIYVEINDSWDTAINKAKSGPAFKSFIKARFT